MFSHPCHITKAMTDPLVENMPTPSTPCPDRIAAFNIGIAADTEPSEVSETEPQIHGTADASDEDRFSGRSYHCCET